LAALASALQGLPCVVKAQAPLKATSLASFQRGTVGGERGADSLVWRSARREHDALFA